MAGLSYEGAKRLFGSFPNWREVVGMSKKKATKHLGKKKNPSIAKGKKIKVKAVKFNRNGSVTLYK